MFCRIVSFKRTILCDIALHDDHIKIHIPYSKTNIIAKTDRARYSKKKVKMCLSRGQTLVHVQGFYLADVFSMEV